jgi:hypothetical protein
MWEVTLVETWTQGKIFRKLKKNFKLPLARIIESTVRCSELSSGIYCRVKWLSMIPDHPWWWRQYAPPKRRSTIILHGSISQKTTLNIILAAVRTWNLTENAVVSTLLLESPKGPTDEKCLRLTNPLIQPCWTTLRWTRHQDDRAYQRVSTTFSRHKVRFTEQVASVWFVCGRDVSETVLRRTFQPKSEEVSGENGIQGTL